jgi:diguanylate cyclase (GGDEF)-like protein
VVLPDCAGGPAVDAAERLRAALHGLDVGIGTPVTASFGVATFPCDGDGSDAVVRAADAALYRAKQDGRDRVAVAGNPAPASPRSGV